MYDLYYIEDITQSRKYRTKFPALGTFLRAFYISTVRDAMIVTLIGNYINVLEIIWKML